MESTVMEKRFSVTSFSFRYCSGKDEKLYGGFTGRKRVFRHWGRLKRLPKEVVDGKIELSFCLQYKRMREYRNTHNLSNFSNWLFLIRKVNKEYSSLYVGYENRHP
jgi:hypothetical protein